jgi:hypothetical protein
MTNGNGQQPPPDQLARFPTGGYVPLQQIRQPMVAPPHDPWENLSWLGDGPVSYLGTRRSRWKVSIDQMLEMWTDELITFLSSYIATLLVGSEYDINCRDPEIRNFFDRMYGMSHQHFMLQSAPALFFGYQGLIERFRFQIPQPAAPDDTGVYWTGKTDPLVISELVQLHPKDCRPVYDEHGSFSGIYVPSLRRNIEAVYSLWITAGGWKCWGDPYGFGRAFACFDPWHKKYFTMDQRTIAVQSGVAPVVKTTYPEGEQADGTDNRTLALSVSEQLRGGGAVAVPSNTYLRNPGINDEATSDPMWDVSYMINTSDIAPFTDIRHDEDKRISLAMLVPPQTVLDAAQSGLGGPNTSEVMAEMAERVLAQDALTIDEHLNRYVFPFILAANFGPDAPPVTKVTKGLNAITRAHLQRVMEILISRGDVDTSFIDLKTIADRLNIPRVMGAELEELEAEQAALAAEESLVEQDAPPPTVPPLQVGDDEERATPAEETGAPPPPTA